MLLPAHRLYILSGPTGSGKSDWIKRLVASGVSASSIISEHAIRVEMLGDRPAAIDPRRRILYENQQNEIGVIFRARVEGRIAQRLTTFIDGSFLTDEERKPWVDMAKRYGVKPEILVFDDPPDHVRQRNRELSHGLNDEVLERDLSRFQASSKYPYRRALDSMPTLLPNGLPHSKIDVIGDIHGLYLPFERLIEKLGYKISEMGVPIHRKDPDRKILLLGDFLDRGPDSIKMLDTAFKMKKAGHFIIAGNHERKLIQYWNSFLDGNPKTRSFSSAQTAMAFMKKSHAARENLIAFLKELPAYYTFEQDGLRLCFLHGNPTYFDPLTTPYSECIYGDNGTLRHEDLMNTDRLYSELFPRHNRYSMIRGHVQQNSYDDNIHVFSLDENQAYDGYLAALPVDALLQRMSWGESFMSACKSVRILEETQYNYNHHRDEFTFKRSMDRLVSDGRVICRRESRFGLLHYRYARRIYFDDLHDNDGSTLLKARGLVLDEAGNIVTHPFDKIFNLHERQDAKPISDNVMVDVIEKINGFQINIARHPFSNTLLITSNDGFDNLLVDIATQFVDQNPALKKGLMRFFTKHQGTLIFEMSDARDTASFFSGEEDEGFWLIGGRDNRHNSPLYNELHLDSIAQALKVRRPARHQMTIRTLKASLEKSTGEGFIARSINEDAQILFKVKTPVYLAEKFISQMNDAKLATLYRDVASACKTMDEDLIPVIRTLTEEIPFDEFVAMKKTERHATIHAFMVKSLGDGNATSISRSPMR